MFIPIFWIFVCQILAVIMPVFWYLYIPNVISTSGYIIYYFLILIGKFFSSSHSGLHRQNTPPQTILFILILYKLSSFIANICSSEVILSFFSWCEIEYLWKKILFYYNFEPYIYTVSCYHDPEEKHTCYFWLNWKPGQFRDNSIKINRSWSQKKTAIKWY